MMPLCMRFSARARKHYDCLREPLSTHFARVVVMISPKVLDSRLKMLGIDSNTRHNLELFRPVLAQRISDIVDAFYLHLRQFPEVTALLPKQGISALQYRQEAHWLEMFECRFDDHYLTSAIKIGRAHFDHKVPPRLYLAGHAFFHCRIIELAAGIYGRSGDLSMLLVSIARVIALDIDLAMSAYTREYWSARPVEAESVWV
jgi:hypothetical protein